MVAMSGNKGTPAAVNHGQVGQELSLVPSPSTLHPIHVACGVEGLRTRLVTYISAVQAFDGSVTLNDQQIFSVAI